MTNLYTVTRILHHKNSSKQKIRRLKSNKKGKVDSQLLKKFKN